MTYKHITNGLALIKLLRDNVDPVTRDYAADGVAELIAALEVEAELAEGLTGRVEVLQAENAKLKAIIAKMDALTPRADKTCDQPGITLSEAVQRQWPELRSITEASA